MRGRRLTSASKISCALSSELPAHSIRSIRWSSFDHSLDFVEITVIRD
jgi:hypothetical protein